MLGDLVGLPVLHGEGVRHDARARAASARSVRAQLHVERRQQVHGDHRRLAEVGGEDVALADRRLARADAGDAGLLALLVARSFAMSGLYSMPTARAPNFFAAAMAILPSPAPRSIDDVVRRHLRHGEHAVDHLVGRRHPDHVLAGLADLRLELLL